MEVSLNHLPSLQSLKFLKEGENTLLSFEDWIQFLRINSTNINTVRRSNILKEIRNHRNGIIEKDDKLFITIQSLVRYITNHSDNSEICNKILSDIVVYVLKQEEPVPSETHSVLNLYKQVAKLNSICWSESLLDTILINDSRTLYTDYKNHFSDIEWKRILLFEYHFIKNFPGYMSYEEELKRKESFLQDLYDSQRFAKRVGKKCEETLSSNQSRKNAADELSGINFISSDVKHSFSKVDSAINDIFRLYGFLKCSAVVVECYEKLCGCNAGVHINIESVTETRDTFVKLCTILRCDLEKQHKLFIHSVVFLNADETIFKRYSCQNCIGSNTHRHEIQDDFFLKKLSDSVLYVSEDNSCGTLDVQDHYTIDRDQNYCSLCFQHLHNWIQDPLRISDLNIGKEWILSVLLEIQQLFCSLFINTASLKKTDQPLQFLQSKIVKLYALFDSGLNLYNKNYTGILQQLNSQELIVSYHSLATIFDITSHSGCTQSLKASERWLLNVADAENSYYNTYIKRYPLVYRATGDEVEKRHEVSLRECLVILFMDNLVRLTVHEDPDPGQSRTSQICTLPITLKGLPRNCSDTRDWHGADCEAEESDDGECLNTRNLDKDDVHLLLEDTEKEAIIWEKFSFQSTWVQSILRDTEGLTIITEMREVLSSQTDLKNLNISMQSLDLDDNNEGVMKTEPSLLTGATCLAEEEMMTLEEIENLMETSLKLDSTIEEEQFVEGIQTRKLNDEQESRIEESYLNNCSGLVTADIDSCSTANQDPLNVSVNKVSSLEVSANANSNDHRLKVYKVPPLLCRHPVPATGRDDDLTNLKEILDDILIKLGRHKSEKTRILFAPDHKISKNLLKLIKENPKYCQFLPEFPVLHLRKSKIVNLFSAYKSAGLVHLFKYMKDSEQEDDWTKLITLQNIETATQNISRLSMALHLAFLMKYLDSLENNLQSSFQEDLHTQEEPVLQQKWGISYRKFLADGSRNATFALDLDIMSHCDEIIAISVAERIGGPEGYSLLLAAVKRSLSFSFLNGASAYAAFCVDLLTAHYSAGIFHQNMKMTLFSTPHRDGEVNIALDTQREMDHKDAIKGFRPRCTLQSVIPRMTIVDQFTGAQKTRQMTLKPDISSSFTGTRDKELESSSPEQNQSTNDSYFHINMAKKDIKQVVPVSKLILRMDVLSTDEEEKPRNAYESKQCYLSEAVLDKNTNSLGQFLIKKYVSSQGLYGFQKTDCPDVSEVEGPKELLRRAKTAKGVTMRRMGFKMKTAESKQSAQEMKRQAAVKKQTKIYACMSSAMNTCQSLVNPDCSKATVQKSQGIKRAIFKALIYTFPDPKQESIEEKLVEKKLLVLGPVPKDIASSIKYATLEFAGVKFKSKATSGEQYLKHIENGIIRRLLYDYPNIAQMVICEEKYSYTPDDFKAGTRAKRQKIDFHSIAHLKTSDEIISDHKLSKSAVLQTGEGKRIISNYLAKNISRMGIQRELLIKVDSELIQKECQCSVACNCPSYCLPICAEFDKNGFVSQSVLENIHQRKGEAEMSQVDWLSEICELNLKSNEAVISVVTSADIDSLVIHLFALSLHWPRNSDSSFKHTVYVLLQKQKPELYNITGIIERLENHFKVKRICMQIALICCIGGNDFLPKFHSISHEKMDD